MDRYGATLQVAEGWQASRLTTRSVLFGANGLRVGSDGKLYVVQAFGSQVSALDPETGASETVSPVGGAIVAPDDIVFDSRDNMYVTEVMNARVSRRTPKGEVEVIADNVPAANGITAHQDRLFMDECRPGGRLFELYPDGREPRLIAEDLPLPNALSVGPDGWLYFPQIAAGEVWRCPIEGGRPERFIDGLAVPSAVKFDADGRLVITQAASGEVTRVDLQSRAATCLATLRPGIDNLAFAPDGRLFVSHFVDGGVAEILPDGSERVLANAGLLGPLGITVGVDGVVYAADGMSMLAVGAGGAITRPTQFTTPGFPGFLRGIAAGAAGEVFVTTSSGDVVRYDLERGEPQFLARGLDELFGLALAPGGGVWVAEGGAGRVLEVGPDGTIAVRASGLGRPHDVVIASDGTCFVSEAQHGRVSQVNGSVTPVLEGLDTPQGLTLVGDRLAVVDAGSKELVSISLETRERRTLATGLPVGAPPGVTPQPLMGIAGLIQGPLPPFAGLASAPDGSLYLAADGEGSILAFHGA